MTDYDAIKAALEKAHTEVGEICRRTGAGRWRMSIPAQPDRDSDLIISDALRHADELLAEVKRLRKENARLRDERGRAIDALSEYGRSAVEISGDLEDGIDAEHRLAVAERDGLLGDVRRLRAELETMTASRAMWRSDAEDADADIARVRGYAEQLAKSDNPAHADHGRSLLSVLDGGER